MSKENKLYNYLFHYNPHTNLWAAFKRDDREKYFNVGGDRSKQNGILYAKEFKTLLTFLTG